MGRIKLVCFDVDGTLVDENSWLFLTEGLGCSVDEHLDLFHKAQNGEISFEAGERLLAEMYQKSGNATLYFIEKLYKGVKLREGAKELVDSLKKKGYKLLLISGAFNLFVAAVSEKLGVTDFCANSSLEFDSNGFLKRIHYRIDKENFKVNKIREFTESLGIDRGEVAIVGNDEQEIEIFKETGRGIAVHCSDEDLIKVAWKTVGSLMEIKEVL